MERRKKQNNRGMSSVLMVCIKNWIQTRLAMATTVRPNVRYTKMMHNEICNCFLIHFLLKKMHADTFSHMMMSVLCACDKWQTATSKRHKLHGFMSAWTSGHAIIYISQRCAHDNVNSLVKYTDVLHIFVLGLNYVFKCVAGSPVPAAPRLNLPHI